MASLTLNVRIATRSLGARPTAGTASPRLASTRGALDMIIGIPDVLGVPLGHRSNT
ncbi:hypothetical protein [Actinomycetospora flava]|uniref:Uncharacterized protein n=1 Tax=Actinomycetospora flava TaxID=3129232 RepID=A0ABU8MB87_9PSEU